MTEKKDYTIDVKDAIRPDTDKKVLLTIHGKDGYKHEIYSEGEAHTLLYADDPDGKALISYEDMTRIGLTFPGLYKDSVKARIKQAWGIPPKIGEGININQGDLLDYRTIEMFCEFTNWNAEICELVCNLSNKKLHKEILDIGFVKMYLLTKRK